MPYIHSNGNDLATLLLQQTLQPKTPTASSTLQYMDLHALQVPSLRDELRLHARYIRDTLVPILSRQSKLTHSDNLLLRSIFKKLEALNVTLDLLRCSRVEKALMVIAATGTSTWPIELVVKAEELIQKWEDKLGPLKNLRADLFGPGGRLEGVRKITDGKKAGLYERDDDSKSAWSVKGVDPLQAYRHGSLGFEVGQWWLKPAAAYRDGIIDRTSHAITADEHGAYAIVVNNSRELNLRPDGTFQYHAAMDDPGAFKLTKTMTSDTEKTIRVLRSWKLRSRLAPKAGVRYDGLYRIESFGIRLVPPDTWHKTFTLVRLPDQAPMSTALTYPMSDQLDDWRDYQRLKHVDRGEDFALLREIIREPTVKMVEELGGEAMERDDSGYFSRRESKLPSRVNSMQNPLPGIVDETPADSSARNNHLANSTLAEYTLENGGTPMVPESMSRITEINTLDGADVFLDPNPTASTMTTNARQSCYFDTDTTTNTVNSSQRSPLRTDTPPSNTNTFDPTSRASWACDWSVWRGLDGGMEAMDWACRRHSSIEEVAPEDSGNRKQSHAFNKIPIDGVARGGEVARQRRLEIQRE